MRPADGNNYTLGSQLLPDTVSLAKPPNLPYTRHRKTFVPNVNRFLDQKVPSVLQGGGGPAARGAAATPVISELRCLRQEANEFETSLGYIVSFKLAWAMYTKTLSKRRRGRGGGRE